MFLNISHPKNDVLTCVVTCCNVLSVFFGHFLQVIGGGSGGMAASKQAADLGAKAKTTHNKNDNEKIEMYNNSYTIINVVLFSCGYEHV